MAAQAVVAHANGVGRHEVGIFGRQSVEPRRADDPGPEQPRPSGPVAAVVANFSSDPRLMWWLRRAALAIVVWLIFTIAVAWQLGVALALLTAAADALYCARTTAVIPAAARVTSAQRRTRWRLARLAPSGYFALHARIVPVTGTVIDHLVIGPAGVYAVDSERWDRRLPFRATHGGRLFHGPYDQADRLEQVRANAAQASALMSQFLREQVEVHPAMVIYGPTVPWVVVNIGGVDVFCGRRLRRYLRREAYANRHQRLDDRQIELVHAAAAQALPPTR